MKCLLFTPSDQADMERIAKYYPIPDMVIYPIDTSQKAADLRKNLIHCSKSIHSLKITNVIVLAANLFKILTKEKKVGNSYGKLLPSKLPEYEGIQISIAPSYQSLFYNPENIKKIEMTLNAVMYGAKEYTQVQGHYPTTVWEAREWLQRLKAYDCLAVDIEGFSLQYTQAEIGTIAFAWSDDEGVAFPGMLQGQSMGYALAEFFSEYKGNMIFHNSPYDVSVLIFELFMQHKLDYRGMLDALDLFYANCDDTKLMVYVIKNSTTEISLKLKDNIVEKYGDYGLDVTDISKIPLPDLLLYNLTDACGTYWLKQKYVPRMHEDNLFTLYAEKLMPAQKVLTYMEMIGMPMIPARIQNARKELEKIIQTQLQVIHSFPQIAEVETILKQRKIEEDNKKLKTITRTMENVKPIPFNPGSNVHLGILFHEVMHIPVVDKTPTGQPAVGEDTIKKLLKIIEDA